MAIQKLPKWFDGTTYKSGEVVANKFSGESIELNNIELSMYDFIMGCQMLIEMNGGLLNKDTGEYQTQMSKGLSWFRQHNAKAYMVLLD